MERDHCFSIEGDDVYETLSMALQGISKTTRMDHVGYFARYGVASGLARRKEQPTRTEISYWLYQLLRRQVQRSIDEQNAKIKNTDGLPRNIFQSLLESDLPPEDKTVERLRQEAQLLLGAGSDTVANSLSITTFHLVDNPEKMSKLASELEKAMPDPNESARLTIVEQLPYLVSLKSLLTRVRMLTFFSLLLFKKAWGKYPWT